MKQNKYRNFELTLKDGSKVIVKGPNKVTEKYAIVLSAHWANSNKRIGIDHENALKSEDIIGIKGIS